MSEKKIATAIDILINVDRFEHIQITKYAEKKIEYETEEDRIAAEDALTAEVVEDGIRSLKIISDTMGGKTVEPTQAIMEKIRKKMPTWLEEGPAPNLANLADDKFKKGVAENEAKQEENKADREERSDEMSDVLGEKEEGEITEEPVDGLADPLDDDNDTLDDIVDEPANDPEEVGPPEGKAEEKPESNTEEKSAGQSPSADEDDIFGEDDDDLFA